MMWHIPNRKFLPEFVGNLSVSTPVPMLPTPCAELWGRDWDLFSKIRACSGKFCSRRLKSHEDQKQLSSYSTVKERPFSINFTTNLSLDQESIGYRSVVR